MAVIAAAAAVIVFGLIAFRPKEDEKLSTSAPLGVWWWTNDNADLYLDFASANGVDEIYYCDYALDEDTYEFVKKAKAAGIKVFALFGEKEWLNSSAGLEALVEKYRLFLAAHPDARFDGIHLDIEPHQFDDFHQNTNEYLTKLVVLVEKIVAENSDIKFDFDIPAWLDKNEESYNVVLNGVKKPAWQHMIDIASRVFVMSYRDTAVAAIDFAENELLYAAQTGKQIAVCFENQSSEGDNVSFAEEGKQALYREIKNLESLLSQDYMVAIHHIKSWYELKQN